VDKFEGVGYHTAGAMLPAFGGTFGRVGLANALYLGELFGALLIFAGFIRATTPITPASE
jgi:hypothetical protein